MPIFSLDSGYGIGDFGESAYAFVDFLKSAGQSFWQILPLVETDLGNSPYSSVYSRSFNPLLISPVLLQKAGLLTKLELASFKLKAKRVNYGLVYENKQKMLSLAFTKRDKLKGYAEFINSREFLDYALFKAISEKSGYKPLSEWDDGLKFKNKSAISKFKKENSKRIEYFRFVQFVAKTQWQTLKKYANENKVKIFGDIPIYASKGSVDVWCNPKLFKLNLDLSPTKVAGVPPDYFCEDGQLWGNPVYEYSAHKQNDYTFFKSKLKHALGIYDIVRIDHFRAFDRFYEIDVRETTAKNGEWVDAPGKEIINALGFAKNKIIAEDLGMIDDGVRELLRYSNYPGMKVLSFAYDGNSENTHLPEKAEENSVCYTGTHDNDTLKGFISSLNEGEFLNLIKGVNKSALRLGVKSRAKSIDGLISCIIKLGSASKSRLFIVPLSDYLKEGSEFRINTPGTVGDFNWSIIVPKSRLKKALAKKIKAISLSYKR